MKLLIKKCSDPLMWYAGMIGQQVPLLRTMPEENCYISLEPSGFSNIVKFGDAEIVEQDLPTLYSHQEKSEGDMDVELLKQFCCRDESKKNICLPWSDGEFTFATDGHILVRVPRLPDFPENNHAPKIEVTPEHSIGKTFLREPAEWVPVPAVDYEGKTCQICNGTKREIICPECDGKGVVYPESIFNIYDEQECKTCNGDGQITNVRFEWFKKNHRYYGASVEESCDRCWGAGITWTMEGKTINGVKINIKFLSLLGKLPGVELGLFDCMDAARFRFDGGEGLVMPMIPDAV